MPEVITSEPNTDDSTESKPLTFEDAVKGIDDGSRITDLEAATALRDQIITHVKSVIRRAKGLTDARKEAARDLVAARALILLPNSLPDWGGASRAYQLLAAETFDAVFSDSDGDLRRTERAAINAHVQRTFLEPAIRSWVLANEADAGGKLRFSEKDDDENSPQFIAAVRKQYRSARQQNGDPLTPPDLYLSAQEKADRSLNPRGGGDAAPFASAMQGLEGLSKVAPLWQARVSLKAVSDLVERVTDGKGTVEERAKVEDYLARINDVALYGAKYLGNKAKGEDRESFNARKFDPKADQGE